VLHTSFGGVTASQQYQGYTTKDRRGEIRQKKENSAANGEFFIIYSFFTASRNGHSATEAATEGSTVKERREAKEKAIKWDEQPPF